MTFSSFQKKKFVNKKNGRGKIFKTMKNRDKDEITAAILEACAEPMTRSKIMYNTILNFSQVTNYASILVRDGLLMAIPMDKTFVITEKGKRYLELYKEIKLVSEELPAISNETK
jgi:predicted transcriptional regulator